MASHRRKKFRKKDPDRPPYDSFLSEDRDGHHQSPDAAPSKKFSNETYPEFFLKYQIPRLIKLKSKQSDINHNNRKSETSANKNSKQNNDEQLLRIANNLGHRYRSSGYFVHGFGKIEVNDYYEKKTPYLYHKSTFPKELELTHKQSKTNKKKEQYFLFEEDEQKMKDEEEIQKMIAIDSEDKLEQVIIEDDRMDEDELLRLKNSDKDIVDTLDTFFSDA
eukprot:55728_1